MKLETLCFLSGLEPPTDPGNGAVEICAVTTHSRACLPGCIYVCISGMQADGHAFIEEALAKGAAAVVTERHHPMSDGFVNKQGSAVFLSCENTRAAAARLYSAWYGHPAAGMTLLAVTGTNGKTTVSSMLYHLLLHAGIPAGLIGTVGSFCCGRRLDIRAADRRVNMTTPDPEQLYHLLSVMAGEGVRTVIMEATSHALALSKLEPLHFDIAIFTNITQDHLDFHGSMEAYTMAKARLLEQSDCAVLNADDATVAAFAQRATCPTLTASAAKAPAADYAADEVRLQGAEGVAYWLRGPDGTAQKIFCPVPGAFTVSNTLLCAACAHRLGLPYPLIAEALACFPGVPGRLERVRGDGLPCSVFIDYAHTPDAMEQLLRSVRDLLLPEQRLIVLFGCGGDRDASKRPMMGEIAARLADLVYLTADNSRSEDPEDILDDIARGIPLGYPYYRIRDRAEAITHAVRHATATDVLILAGKGHENYEIDRDGWHPFDERAIVRAAAAQKQ